MPSGRWLPTLCIVDSVTAGGTRCWRAWRCRFVPFAWFLWRRGQGDQNEGEIWERRWDRGVEAREWWEEGKGEEKSLGSYYRDERASCSLIWRR